MVPAPALRLRRGGRLRTEARDDAEARAGHTSSWPKPDPMRRTARRTRSSPKRAETALSRSTRSPRTATAEPGTPATDVMTEATNIRSRARQPRTSRRSHTRRSGHPRSSVRSVAVSSPRQCNRRHRYEPPKRPAPSIRLHCNRESGDGRASTSVPFSTHIRRRRANPQCCSEPSNTRGVRSHSRSRPPKRPET
jgi:hypothetical protein